MTIDLAQLREDISTIDSGSLDHGMTLVDPDDLRALIDIAEAAHALFHGPLNDPENSYSADPYGLTDEISHLARTLARFDFKERR